MANAAGKVGLKKDDIVEVISGKEKGKKGKVLSLISEDASVTIEKLNMFKRHMKGDGKSRQAGIVEREGKIHISNVLLVCDKCGNSIEGQFNICWNCGQGMN